MECRHLFQERNPSRVATEKPKRIRSSPATQQYGNNVDRYERGGQRAVLLLPLGLRRENEGLLSGVKHRHGQCAVILEGILPVLHF